MDNEKNNQDNRKSKPEQNSSQENIPLWLQGLDNTESGEKPEKSHTDQGDGSWTKEVNELSDEEANQQDQQSEKHLPDWLSELSEVESEMPKIKENEQADESQNTTDNDRSGSEDHDADEITEKVEIKNTHTEETDAPTDHTGEENLRNEGFVEISEMDLTDEPQPDQIAFDESLSEAEELPYWLKDMIVEQPGESYPHKAMTYAEIVALSKEDTKPIKVASEAEVSEEDLSEEEVSDLEQPQAMLEQEEQKEDFKEIETLEVPEEQIQAEPLADEESPELLDDTKPIKPYPELAESEKTEDSEIDQPIAEDVDKETPPTEQPLETSQKQEEFEETAEVEQEQWAESEAAAPSTAPDLDEPAEWIEHQPDQELAKTADEWPEQTSVEKEVGSPDPWLDQETGEPADELPAPLHWPEDELEATETELQAPDQWLEEDSGDDEPDFVEPDDWQEPEQIEETSSASAIEHEIHDEEELLTAAEDTEEITVKGLEQTTEDFSEQEGVESQIDREGEISKSDMEKEGDLPSTAIPEEVQVEFDETEQPEGTPKTLRFAKYLLDQGDYDRAKEIFKPYIDNNQFLEDIETWLIDASNNGARKHSGTWELIGDIAMAKSNPNQAFEAYKQAITVLLSTKKELNETH